MRELRFALKQTVPILFEYVFIGLSFGILMADMGYSPLWSAFSALTIYAGSMQLVMISLLKAGTPLLTLVFTAFAVNARHIFYGIGFVEKFRRRHSASVEKEYVRLHHSRHSNIYGADTHGICSIIAYGNAAVNVI